MAFIKDLTEEEINKASEGKLCPYCKSEEIHAVGCAPTPMGVNIFYDCLECGEGWEGY